MPVTAALNVGAYCGAPVHLPDGTRRPTVVQPIVDLATGVTVEFEVLSRFTDPTGAPAARTTCSPMPSTSVSASASSKPPPAPPSSCSPTSPRATYLSVNLHDVRSPEAMSHRDCVTLLGGT